MSRSWVLFLLTVAGAARAQNSITAKEAFPVDADAGVYGAYGFTAYPGQAEAFTFKTGGPPYVVTLGGSSAGAVKPLAAPAGSTPLGGTPDCLILAQDSSYWGAFYQLLELQPSSYTLSSANFGQTAHLTRDSNGHLRLAYYNGGQVTLARVTSAATLSSTGLVTVTGPSPSSFVGKWLQSPPGSDLMYEFTEPYDQVRLADYGGTSPAFGAPYAVSGVRRARLYWAGGTTTYVVTVGGGGISIIELGATAATLKGSFAVGLPQGVTCSGCSLSDLEIAQQAFPGYSSGAIIAVFSNKNASNPPPAVLALVDWADVAALLSLSTDASVASAALLEPAGGGGGTGNPTTQTPAPVSPYATPPSSGGCSGTGAGGLPMLGVALLIGWALLPRARAPR